MQSQLFGGHVADEDTLIPVRLDENSPIEFISKKDASQIISKELIHQTEHYESLNEDDKEEYLSKLVIEHLKHDPSILDREVVQCAMNKTIYELLRTFYIPDSLSKTIASWIEWFLKGLGSISYAFAKSTYLYMLSHWQRILLLVSIDYIALPLIGAMFVSKFDILSGLKDGDLSGAGILDKVKTVADNHVNNIESDLKLIDTIEGYAQYFIWMTYGVMLIDFLKVLHNNMSDINTNCILPHTNLQPSARTKQNINKQLENAFVEIQQSSAVKKAIKQSRSLKNKSPKLLEQQFIDHVQNAVDTTPVHEITTAIEMPTSNPENVSPDQFIMSIVRFSTDLNESIRLQPPTPEEQIIAPEIQLIKEQEPNQFSIQLASLSSLQPPQIELTSKPVDDVAILDQDPLAQNISKQLTNQFSIILDEL